MDESLYRNHFFLTPEMWDEQIYNTIVAIRAIGGYCIIRIQVQ